MKTRIDSLMLFNLFRLAYILILLSVLAVFSTKCGKDPDPKLGIISISPESGKEGSIVTISGSGFRAKPQEILVTFGTINAEVTNATSKQITVTVPAGAVDGKITVTVKGVTIESPNDFKVKDRWERMADFDGGGRDYPFCFSVNGKGYVGSGYNLGALVDLWEFDPVTNVWTQKQNFGGPGRMYAAAFGIGSKGYVTCGYVTTLFNDVWEYDPVNNSWAPKQNFPGGARFASVSFTIGSKGYVAAGGVSGSNVDFKDLWEYDPSNDTWTRKADLPGAPRTWAFSFAIASNGYIGGGSDRPGIELFDLYEYNSTTNQWSQKASLPDAAHHLNFLATAITSDSKGYVGGNGIELWQFDPAANTWLRQKDIPSFVIGNTFTIGEHGYFGDSYFKTFYRYFPE